MSDNSMILIHSSGRVVDLAANSKDNPLRPLTPGAPIDLKVHSNGREGYDFTSVRLAFPGQSQALDRNFTHPSSNSPRASLAEPEAPVRYRIDVDWARNKGGLQQTSGTKPFGLWVGPWEEGHEGESLQSLHAKVDALNRHLGVEV